MVRAAAHSAIHFVELIVGKNYGLLVVTGRLSVRYTGWHTVEDNWIVLAEVLDQQWNRE